MYPVWTVGEICILSILEKERKSKGIEKEINIKNEWQNRKKENKEWVGKSKVRKRKKKKMKHESKKKERVEK